MDADDVCLPDRLRLQVQYMQQHPSCVLLGTGFELIDSRDRLLTTRIPPSGDAALQRHCLEGRCPILHSAAMFRREVALRVGGYDPRYAVAQDLDLWLRMGEAGALASLRQVLVRYRMHAASLSERRQHEQMSETQAACETARVRRGVDTEYKGSAGWRAIGDRESRFRQTLKYGWWAFNSGERATARSYGLSAIHLNPTDPRGYRLLFASFKPQRERLSALADAFQLPAVGDEREHADA
jgi:hypothetical protein